MVMNVLIAGGTGAIGIPLARALFAAGHHVTVLSRSTARHAELRAQGLTAVAADALDREALARAVDRAHPTHVIHQLTALPKDGPRRARDIEATNRLRTDGTRNLLEAAVRAGAGRFIAGSFALLADQAETAMAPANPAADAVCSMETQVRAADAAGAIEGIVLRYGLFYGLDAPSTRAMLEQVRRRRLPVIRGDAGALPMIHVTDAVSATVQALTRGRRGETYTIVDDKSVSMTDFIRTMAAAANAPAPFAVPAWVPRLVAPMVARMSSVNLHLSNARAKADLGWQPRFGTVAEGLAHDLGRTVDERPGPTGSPIPVGH